MLSSNSLPPGNNVSLESLRRRHFVASRNSLQNLPVPTCADVRRRPRRGVGREPHLPTSEARVQELPSGLGRCLRPTHTGRVATRYDKLAVTFLGFIHLEAFFEWHFVVVGPRPIPRRIE